jgi:hypothetical protein
MQRPTESRNALPPNRQFRLRRYLPFDGFEHCTDQRRFIGRAFAVVDADEGRRVGDDRTERRNADAVEARDVCYSSNSVSLAQRWQELERRR